MRYLLPLCMFVLVGCASHVVNEGPFHYDQAVEVSSPKSFYNSCHGYISSKVIIGGKTAYFVNSLCRKDQEDYFYANELMAL